MTCREAKALLGGYLDGELDLVHSLELEEHIGQCPSCSAELKRLQEVSGAVSRALRYPASAGLRARLAQPPREYPVWPAAAALVFLAAVGVWKWMPAGSTPQTALEREIVQNHVRSLLANHLLDVPSSDWRAVQPWFRGKLDYAPVVEDISAQGFALSGGRLDYLDGRIVAALVYQRGQHVVNVFVWPAPRQGDRAPEAHALEGYTVVGWRANGMNWWAVSDLGPVELEELPLSPCFREPKSTLNAEAVLPPRRQPI